MHEVAKAKALLKEGRERAEQLAAGKTPWATAAGLVVRGYVSKIDGSVQPYGLVVPETIGDKNSGRHPLDIWFHGRNEAYTELNFIDERNHSRGQFTPPNTIVLHPYGRYCNASKFAGETDLFEAIKSVSERYAIDEDRICVRGFSMGGASTWHTAVHFAGEWCAANPGAGFAETTEFLRIFQNEVIHPTAYEEKLLHWYDSTDWAGNLFNCPTVAYSGEIDTQKQAADMMQKAMEREGLKLTYIIGPQHKARLSSRVGEDRQQADGRSRRERPQRDAERSPFHDVHAEIQHARLGHCQCASRTLEAGRRAWRRSRNRNTVEITTKNVAALIACNSAGRIPSGPIVETGHGDDRRRQDRIRTNLPGRGITYWSCRLHRKSNGKWDSKTAASRRPW